jgi:hypothetical protein
VKPNWRRRSSATRPLLMVLAANTAVVALATGLVTPASVLGLAGVAGGQHNHGTPPPVAAPAPAPQNLADGLPGLPTVGSGAGDSRAFAPASPGEDFSLLELYARKAQDIDRLFVTARMHESGSLTMNATLSVADGGGGASAKPKLMRFARRARNVPPHLKTKLRLVLGKSDLRAAKRALRQGQSLTVKISVTGRGVSGKKTTAVRNVRLRFEGIGGVRAELAQILTFLKALVGADVLKQGLSTTPGPEGPQGEPGRSALSDLQPGETERGTVGGETAAAIDTEVAFSATLPIPAPFGLDDDHVIVDGNSDQGEETADQCTGSAADPQATKGYLCIYPFSHYNDRDARGFIWGNTQDGNAKWGFQVSWYSTADPPTNTAFFANWAYTAPGEAPPPPEHNH